MTTFKKSTEEDLSFPAVTLCNNNPVHCRNIENLIINLHESPTGQEERIQNLCKVYIFGRCDIVNKRADLFTYGSISNDTDICQDKEFEDQLDKISGLPKFKESLLYTLLAALTDTDRVAIAHQPKQMFKSCFFQNIGRHPACVGLLSGSTKAQNSKQLLEFFFFKVSVEGAINIHGVQSLLDQYNGYRKMALGIRNTITKF